MKIAAKMLSIILAVIMVIGLVPFAAYAENGSGNDETGEYVIHCILGAGLPAANAKIVMTDMLAENSTETYTADSKGIVRIPKALNGVYSLSVSCEGPVQGIVWQCLPELRLDMSTVGDEICLKLFPVLAVELEYAEHNAYMVGYSDGTFGPNNPITRAEVASLLYRLMSDEAREKYYSSENSFTDVQRSMAHNVAISTLANAGVIEGITEHSFGYKDIITRAQFAAMLGRLFGIEYTGGDVFKDTDSSFAEPYFNLLGKLGILIGDGKGKVFPDKELSRAEVCAMLNRLLGRTAGAESTSSLSDSNTLKTFSDISPDMALYADILEATNSHSFEYSVRDDGTIFECWTLLDPSINWISTQHMA